MGEGGHGEVQGVRMGGWGGELEGEGALEGGEKSKLSCKVYLLFFLFLFLLFHGGGVSSEGYFKATSD